MQYDPTLAVAEQAEPPEPGRLCALSFAAYWKL